MTDGQRCPKCGEMSSHRSKARWFGERLYKRFTVLRAYRCADCGWRGWLHPSADIQGATVVQHAQPNLSAIGFTDGAEPLPKSNSSKER